MSDPLITVLLPIYNGEQTLAVTIQSLLDQNYQTFEILACIDGTTDNSLNILNEFKDRRIKVFINKKNRGLGATLNRLVYEANTHSKYLAIAEQDDYYYPYRFKDQVDFLEKREDVGLVSGIAEHWNGQKVTTKFPGILVGGKDYPEGEEMFLLNYINQIKVVNSCMMIRKSVHIENGLYFSSHYPSISVDWSYILRFSLISKIAGINKVFVRLDRRVNRNSLTIQKNKQFSAARELLRSFQYERSDIVTNEVYKKAFKNQLLLEGKYLKVLFENPFNKKKLEYILQRVKKKAISFKEIFS